MAIEDLAGPFAVVNPHGGANPNMNCMQCAVNTARALVLGAAPVPVPGAGGATISGNGVAPMQTFLDTLADRADAVLQYLRFTAPAGVYAVDAEDHAYNFVVVPAGRVFLIDSNQQIYKRVRVVGDLQATLHNATLADTIAYNYGNPPAGEDGSNMVFYHWGALHPRWHILLAQVGGRVWYDVGGGAQRQLLVWGRGSMTVD